MSKVLIGSIWRNLIKNKNLAGDPLQLGIGVFDPIDGTLQPFQEFVQDH
jgi:hypothetical protein